MTSTAASTSPPRLSRGAMTGDRATRTAGAGVVVAIVLAMLVPPAMVVALSFSGERYFDFPPHSWGLRQYRVLLEDPRWGSALWLSVKIAVPVALLAAAVVVPALFTFHRSRLPARNALQLGGLTGLVLPVSAYAVAIYGVFVQTGLLGTYFGLVLADLTLALPVMLLVTSPALSRIPEELELAAMVAGASRARAWIEITVRLLAPAILAGGVLAFMTSFDESVFINFLGGPGQETLPRAILDSVRFGLDPVVTAIATLLILGTSAAMIFAVRLTRDRG
ncbi:MAG TPA: ABC transporter permease [Solirubrobacteraceae bacterium]|nr:ABC transporter permease [Solirubrobacteraceae bacterium]